MRQEEGTDVTSTQEQTQTPDHELELYADPRDVEIGVDANTVRRLGQHNGLLKGGAAKTNVDNLRPWEMTCIVTGFPSQIAALQFEWAWQNPHVTLHIPPESRIQHATQNKRSGQPRRPRHSITTLLSTLHLLLRVPSFSRWPLQLRFFSEDVHKAWVKYTNRSSEPLRDSLKIIQDFPPSSAPSEDESNLRSNAHQRKIEYGIHGLIVDYANEKPYVEKSKGIIEFEREGSCSLCKSELEHDAGIYTICPNPGCEAVTHMACLSKHFLKTDSQALTLDPLIPMQGNCPTCKVELMWVDIVKELTLRMRGQKPVAALLKQKRVKKAKAESASQAIPELSNEESEEEMEKEVLEQLKELHELNPQGGGLAFGDSWHVIDDSEDSDLESITSTIPSAAQIPRPSAYQMGQVAGSNTVIEDSDWDDAQVLD
ncbi:hypothetical protein B7494_g7407 [Chlorociboria aeruginascens]|nr:hypothetical protein B7494_g7407 [Chlorociboria aeruginascens]